MTPDRQEITAHLDLLDTDEERLLVWLDSFSLFAGERARTNLRLIDEQLQDRSLLVSIFELSCSCADPDNALNVLERLFDVVDTEQLKSVLVDEQQCRSLLMILGGSPFLSGILCRQKEYFSQLFISADLHKSCHEDEMLADLRRLVPDGSDFSRLQQQLRQYKSKQVLRIGSRDLCGLTSLEEVMAELSSLAAACLQRAYEVCGQQLQKEYGQPLEVIEEGQSQFAEMTVLGMGKFGGNELNFSSDIDLIYCYSSIMVKPKVAVAKRKSACTVILSNWRK